MPHKSTQVASIPWRWLPGLKWRTAADGLTTFIIRGKAGGGSISFLFFKGKTGGLRSAAMAAQKYT
jgi:hypothetical protein